MRQRIRHLRDAHGVFQPRRVGLTQADREHRRVSMELTNFKRKLAADIAMRTLMAQELPRLHQIPAGALLLNDCECEACGRRFTRSIHVDHYRAHMLNTPCPGLLGLLRSPDGAPSSRRGSYARLVARCRRTAAQKREVRSAWHAALAEARLFVSQKAQALCVAGARKAELPALLCATLC